jgi:hypothetical protein
MFLLEIESDLLFYFLLNRSYDSMIDLWESISFVNYLYTSSFDGTLIIWVTWLLRSAPVEYPKLLKDIMPPDCVGF